MLKVLVETVSLALARMHLAVMRLRDSELRKRMMVKTDLS